MAPSRIFLKLYLFWIEGCFIFHFVYGSPYLAVLFFQIGRIRRGRARDFRLPVLQIRTGIRTLFSPDPDPGSQIHIFESLMTIFWAESSIILCKLAQIFFFTSSKLIYFTILWFLWLLKKVGQRIFFTPLFCCCFWIRDPGWTKVRIGINIKDPQHCG